MNAENSSLQHQIIERNKELEIEREEKEKALRNLAAAQGMCDQLFEKKMAAEGEVRRLREEIEELKRREQAGVIIEKV